MGRGDSGFPFPRNSTPGGEGGAGKHWTAADAKLIVGAQGCFPNLFVFLSVYGRRYCVKYYGGQECSINGERRDRGAAAIPKGEKGSR